MRPEASNVDRQVAAKAGQQHGLVTLAQLVECGLGRGAIKTRISRGWLIRLHRGVYAVGHRPTTAAAAYLGASLAAGGDARVSGLAAAYLLSLVDERADPEVTVSARRRIPGVLVHRSRLVGSRHTTNLDRVPVSRPADALVEIAGRLGDVELSRAIQTAIVRYRVTEHALLVALRDRPRQHDRARLAALFLGDDPRVLSELERAFVELLGDAALPLPTTNRLTDGRYVDCRWPGHRLTVELLGFRFHSSRGAWEADHARRREAQARGERFLALTHDDVTRHRDATLAQLRELLG